jgi:imidazolonepropionase-like amidohydrolase
VDKIGKIVHVGTEKELSSKYADSDFEIDIDATGKCVLPGS